MRTRRKGKASVKADSNPDASSVPQVVLGVAYAKEIQIKPTLVPDTSTILDSTDHVKESSNVMVIEGDDTNIVIEDRSEAANRERENVENRSTSANQVLNNIDSVSTLFEEERHELDEPLVDPETGEMRKRGDKILDSKKRKRCHHCDKTFCSSFMLMEHVKVAHEKVADHECDQCDYKTARRSCLVLHKRRMHDKWKPYKCSEENCNFTAYHLYKVNDHINIVHKKVKPFPCTYADCDYSGVSRTALNLHIKRTHEKIKSFACPDCDYKTNKNYALQYHRNSKHLKVKPFSCSACDFTAATKGVIANHYKRVHLGLTAAKGEMEQCPHCDYKTTIKPHLRDHVRSVHLGIKQFHCGICNFECASKASIKRHVLIHTGAKDFACSLCTYRCSRKMHLEEHMANVHVKSFDFQCQLCTYKTSTKQRLQKHLRQNHKDGKEIIDEPVASRPGRKKSVIKSKKSAFETTEQVTEVIISDPSGFGQDSIVMIPTSVEVPVSLSIPDIDQSVNVVQLDSLSAPTVVSSTGARVPEFWSNA